MPPSSLTQKTECLVDRRLYNTTNVFFYMLPKHIFEKQCGLFCHSLNGEWQISLAGTSGNHLKGGQERAGKQRVENNPIPSY